MTTKGFTRNFKPLEILTEEQVEAIHRGILDVLENTGVRVEHDRAIKLFKKNGCQVDYNERRVRIPAGLVEECLRKTPSSFHVKARDPKNDLQMGGNTCYFAPFPGMRTTDLDTWEARPATRKERDDGCIVLDALDNVHCCGGPIPYFETEGIPPAMATPEAFAALLRNSTKIQISSHQLGCEVFNIAMAKAAGTETFGLCLLAPPLTFPADTVESLFRGIEAGLPVILDLNMMDETEAAGIKVDVNRLEEKLGIPVVTTVATTGRGVETLRRRLLEYVRSQSCTAQV